MKKLLAIALSTILMGTAAAQTTEETTAKTSRIKEFYLFSGFGLMRAQTGSLETYNKLAPNSVLLQNPELDDNITLSSGFLNGGGTQLAALVGLKLGKINTEANSNNTTLRLGLHYKTGYLLSGYAHKSRTTRYDTLTSSQTGQQYYIDSVESKYYNFNYHTQQLLLDAALIFRTKAASRWSAYTGVGLVGGASMNATTELSQSTSYKTTLQYNNSYNSSYSYSRSNYAFETNKSPNCLVYGAYIPLGLDFRLAKNHEFWKQVHLYYEAQLSVSGAHVRGLPAMYSPTIQQGLGLRFSWG